MLSIDFQAEGVVAIAGRLDAAEAPRADAFLEKVGKPFTLDCSKLEYISSAGLGVLLKNQKRLMATGGKMKLRGLNSHLRDIFRYAGFDRIFEIEPAPGNTPV